MLALFLHIALYLSHTALVIESSQTDFLIKLLCVKIESVISETGARLLGGIRRGETPGRGQIEQSLYLCL